MAEGGQFSRILQYTAAVQKIVVNARLEANALVKANLKRLTTR